MSPVSVRVNRRDFRCTAFSTESRLAPKLSAIRAPTGGVSEQRILRGSEHLSDGRALPVPRRGLSTHDVAQSGLGHASVPGDPTLTLSRRNDRELQRHVHGITTLLSWSKLRCWLAGASYEAGKIFRCRTGRMGGGSPSSTPNKEMRRGWQFGMALGTPMKQLARAVSPSRTETGCKECPCVGLLADQARLALRLALRSFSEGGSSSGGEGLGLLLDDPCRSHYSCY